MRAPSSRIARSCADAAAARKRPVGAIFEWTDSDTVRRRAMPKARRSAPIVGLRSGPRALQAAQFVFFFGAEVGEALLGCFPVEIGSALQLRLTVELASASRNSARAFVLAAGEFHHRKLLQRARFVAFGEMLDHARRS